MWLILRSTLLIRSNHHLMRLSTFTTYYHMTCSYDLTITVICCDLTTSAALCVHLIGPSGSQEVFAWYDHQYHLVCSPCVFISNDYQCFVVSLRQWLELLYLTNLIISFTVRVPEHYHTCFIHLIWLLVLFTWWNCHLMCVLGMRTRFTPNLSMCQLMHSPRLLTTRT